MILAERRSLRPTNTKILSEKRTRKTTGIFHKILQPIPRAEQTTPRLPGSFCVQFFRPPRPAPDPPGKSSVILHKNHKRPLPKCIPFGKADRLGKTGLFTVILTEIHREPLLLFRNIRCTMLLYRRVSKGIPFGTFLGGMRWTTRDPKTKEKNEGGKT